MMSNSCPEAQNTRCEVQMRSLKCLSRIIVYCNSLLLPHTWGWLLILYQRRRILRCSDEGLFARTHQHNGWNMLLKANTLGEIPVLVSFKLYTNPNPPNIFFFSLSLSFETLLPTQSSNQVSCLSRPPSGLEISQRRSTHPATEMK